MANKNIETPEEIKGLLYIVDYIKEMYFPSVSVMKSKHFTDICGLADEIGRDISKSTITRIFNFKRKPTSLSFEKLDDLTYWCFRGEYFNFKEFLKEMNDDIEKSSLIKTDELNTIVEKLKDKKEIAINKKNTDVIHLGSNTKGIQINLDEGVVKNILESVAFRFGDLLSNELVKHPEVISDASFGRVSERIKRTEHWRQNNCENIIDKAIEYGRSFEPSSNTVDPDWISEFFNISQECSNEMLQYLWAKLLAGEVDKPGSFSRRTLHAIKLLEAEEASYFTLLCNCLWETYPGDSRSDKVLFKNSNNHGKFSDSTWGFDSNILQHLEDLGLIHTTYMILERDFTIPLSYFEKLHELATVENAVEIEIVRLSSIGKEISTIILAQENESYYHHTLEFMTQQKILRK